ncbi:MAG: hypothetical protein AABY40_02110 [Nanoarchaeota archaeon]
MPGTVENLQVDISLVFKAIIAVFVSAGNVPEGWPLLNIGGVLSAYCNAFPAKFSIEEKLTKTKPITTKPIITAIAIITPIIIEFFVEFFFFKC